jgi:hypothetical protein
MSLSLSFFILSFKLLFFFPGPKTAKTPSSPTEQKRRASHVRVNTSILEAAPSHDSSCSWLAPSGTAASALNSTHYSSFPSNHLAVIKPTKKKNHHFIEHRERERGGERIDGSQRDTVWKRASSSIGSRQGAHLVKVKL